MRRILSYGAVWIGCASLMLVNSSIGAGEVERIVSQMRTDPNNVILALELSQALAREGQLEKAAGLLRKIESSVNDKLRDEAGRKEDHYALGLCSAYQEKYYVATAHFKKALELDARYVSARIALAKSLFKLGKKDEAIQSLKDGISEGAGEVELRNALAELYQAFGNWEKAIGEYEHLEREEPENETYAMRLLALYVEVGDVEKAEVRFRVLVEKGELSEFDKTLRIAEMMMSNKDMRGASRQLQAARRIDPEHPALNPYFESYYLSMARLAMEEGQGSRAALMCQRALEYVPESREAIYLLGRAYALEEDYQAACDEFTKLLKEPPLEAEYYASFALSLNEIGKYELAYEIVERGRRLAVSESDRESLLVFEEARKAIDESNRAVAAGEKGIGSGE